MSLKNLTKILTRTQQNAIHVYFRQVALEMNNKGIDLKMALDAKPIDVSMDEEMVKNLLFKKILFAISEKESTTEMSTTQVNQTFEQLNRWLGNEFGIHIPFPEIKKEDKPV